MILYEDAYCLAVCKPENMLVHHSHYARNLQDEETLLDYISAFHKTSVYPIHRLDYKTSGVVLCAKEKDYVKEFQKLFDTQVITKQYLALVRGFINESGVIETPIKDLSGKYKEAKSIYTRIERFTINMAVHPYQEARYSLVQFTPQTGRQHQLRKHANKMSHPIIGDHKYGNRHHNKMFASCLGLPHLFLHAQSLRFTHPLLSTEICIEAPLPAYWDVLFKKLKDLKTIG